MSSIDAERMSRCTMHVENVFMPEDHYYIYVTAWHQGKQIKASLSELSRESLEEIKRAVDYLLGQLGPYKDPVDLLSGSLYSHPGGIVTFRNGKRLHSLSVGPDGDGEIEVRIENGVYKGYTRNGRPCKLENGHWEPVRDAPESSMDIVAFRRCDYTDPEACTLPTEYPYG